MVPQDRHIICITTTTVALLPLQPGQRAQSPCLCWLSLGRLMLSWLTMSPGLGQTICSTCDLPRGANSPVHQALAYDHVGARNTLYRLGNIQPALALSPLYRCGNLTLPEVQKQGAQS